MNGTELCAGQGSFFARVGTFTADGNGNITNGLEDLNVCTGTDILQFTGGKYSIGVDGRGSLSLTNSTGTTNYSISLASSTQGTVAQVDRRHGKRHVTASEPGDVFQCSDWRRIRF